MADRAGDNLRVSGAIAFLREHWYDDGAEGESVHLVCRAAEQARADLAAAVERAEAAEQHVDELVAAAVGKDHAFLHGEAAAALARAEAAEDALAAIRDDHYCVGGCSVCVALRVYMAKRAELRR